MFTEAIPHQKSGLHGGTVSSYLLINYLKNFFDVHVLACADNIQDKISPEDCLTFHKVKVIKFSKPGVLNECILRNTFRAELRKKLKIIQPKILISSTKLINICVDAAIRNNIKSIIWLRGYENFYSYEYFYPSSKLSWLDFQLRLLVFKHVDYNAIKNASLVLTNSQYMKDKIDRVFKVESKVVYPPINFGAFSQIRATQNKNIGFIHPEIKKGLQIAIEIAKRMPDQNFTYFGKPPLDYLDIMNRNPNIHFAGWQSDPKEIFSIINILIVPSIWPEPFGRAPVEAIAAGVLPIVSNMGGLAETVGNREMIVDDVYNIEAWVTKINFFLADCNAYDRVVQQAKSYIKKFELGEQGRAFKNLIDNIIY
jgi:glycosyltransferase involved in cell wall biosynthesis